MHPQNHWYGHSQFLAEYAGLGPDRVPRIDGYLQHGWNVHNGFGIRTPLLPAVTKLVWSARPMRRGWRYGDRNYRIIGSPWAYLLQVAPAAPVERSGTIFYPFHGIPTQSVTGDHAKLAREVRETEEGPLTAALYWLEYEQPAIRRAYEQAGFRVICHGYRLGGFDRGSNAMLRNQLMELRRHRRVVSNRLATAVLYGASVGCDVGIYGDEMLLADEHPIYGGNARIRRTWPQLHATFVDREEAAAVADEELGLSAILSPAELADACGWSRPEPGETGPELPHQRTDRRD
ncbi:MAG: hypothetical protein HOU81_02035 [Hamadaea sp.]|uniref:hypothetical protein n=1 Tax=Hamadaea sp. TaxID=2024425 RepID=UPI00181B73C0|nr:hypothetical protein [Hamadaea sp.]NUR69578.1 hypothetical protein [Hamadaea sp.]NUT20310.1 hypothetical protein [Hamadaea sp.]